MSTFNKKFQSVSHSNDTPTPANIQNIKQKIEKIIYPKNYLKYPTFLYDDIYRKLNNILSTKVKISKLTVFPVSNEQFLTKLITKESLLFSEIPLIKTNTNNYFDYYNEFVIKLKENVFMANFIIKSTTINEYTNRWFVCINSNDNDILQQILSVLPILKKKHDEWHSHYRNEPNVDKIFKNIFLGNLKKDILDDIDMFMNSYKTYLDLGITWKRGYIFSGPPGNGKTLFIRKLSKAYDIPAIDLLNLIDNNGNLMLDKSNSDVMNDGYRSYIKLSSLVTDKINLKKKIKKIYYLEDIEKTVGKKSEDYAKISLSSLLNGIDGVSELEDGFLLIATTNYIKDLYDPIVGRPGRIDRIFNFDLPKYEQIKEFLNYHRVNVSGTDIANDLDGFSMAFVEEFVKSAKMMYKKDNFTKNEVISIIQRLNEHKKLREEFDKKIGF